MQERFGNLRTADRPGCGWYHIYTYDPSQPDAEALRWQAYFPGETLALVRLDIGAFRKEALSPEALSYMDDILNTFAAHGVEVILRVCYDICGNGMAREPQTFETVCLHLRQIAAFAAAHARAIYTAQGLLIGSWGEMHGSRYCDADQIRRLAWLWQLESGGVPLSVRTPRLLRMLPGNVRAGLFDDALCTDPTHLGTFENEQDIAYVQQAAVGLPCGGEALWTDAPLPAAEVLRQLEALRISYLNSVYDARRLEEWKAIPWGQGTLYDEISRRLGYRLVVVRKRIRAGKLTAVIKNEGFAPLWQDADLFAETDAGRMLLPCDLKTLGGGCSVRVSCGVPAADARLRLVRRKDGREIPLEG